MITELEDFDLTHHNTFGMRVKCARWIEYTSSDDLPELFRRIGSSPFKAIGEGLSGRVAAFAHFGHGSRSR